LIMAKTKTSSSSSKSSTRKAPSTRKAATGTGKLKKNSLKSKTSTSKKAAATKKATSKSSAVKSAAGKKTKAASKNSAKTAQGKVVSGKRQTKAAVKPSVTKKNKKEASSATGSTALKKSSTSSSSSKAKLSSGKSKPAAASDKTSSKPRSSKAPASKSAPLKPAKSARKAKTLSARSEEVIGTGKKTSAVVQDAPAVQKKALLQDPADMTKNSASKNGSAPGAAADHSMTDSTLAAQISVEQVPEVPVKRKRGRPRKSESLNGTGSPQKLKETKGVRRFGMNYGRPGVAAGRYSWSAETGTSSSGEGTPADETAAVTNGTSLAQEIEVEFSQGDKVVYPAHGLGIIEAIQIRNVGGSQQKFYMISIVETGMKIMVPVGQSKTVGLRRVVDPGTVDRVYDILRDKDIVIDNQTWNRRYREYSQKIKTGSVLEIASVIRDLTVLKIEKELSFNERRMLDTAQGLLVKELSIAKSSSEDSIKEELELICQP
jgi:CarD family transcriptional regulator